MYFAVIHVLINGQSTWIHLL